MIQTDTGVTGIPKFDAEHWDDPTKNECIIKDNITFVAFFGNTGNVEYTIKYWFQTVQSAKDKDPVIPTEATGDA